MKPWGRNTGLLGFAAVCMNMHFCTSENPDFYLDRIPLLAASHHNVARSYLHTLYIHTYSRNLHACMRLSKGENRWNPKTPPLGNTGRDRVAESGARGMYMGGWSLSSLGSSLECEDHPLAGRYCGSTIAARATLIPGKPQHLTGRSRPFFRLNLQRNTQ